MTADLYVSYMSYAATGEGLTFAMVVAHGADHAEKTLKEKLDPYFHGGIATNRLTSDSIVESTDQRVIELVPTAIWNTLNGLPPSAGYYFSELHYNVS